MEPASKYGVKKVKFCIADPTVMDPKTVEIHIILNDTLMGKFPIKISGMALEKRRKNLQNELAGINKGYYKEINVSRSKLLENLYDFSQKSMNVNWSVRFANEVGIDAGGLKREFYDLVGNEMKNPKNPFFRAIKGDFE